MSDQRRKPEVAPWAALLPPDLLGRVYEVAEREGVLRLKDRLQALAVCKAWKKALSSLPIRYLLLQGGDEALCDWVIQRQPTVISLELWDTAIRAIDVLAALQGKGLTILKWFLPASLQTADALPRPLEPIPSLRKLDLGGCVASAWLRKLSSLQSLETLSLTIPELSDAATAGAAVRFPSLPSLACLQLRVWSGPPDLHIQLDGLPALTELELLDGSVAVLASEPAPQLQRLANDAGQLAVDFAALPGLKSAKLFTACHLERPASIAAATALTYLELTSEYEWDPSSLELLQSLPPSVRCLSMDKDWPQEAANLVGRMTSLVGLELLQEYASPLPADDAPVWAGLRALQSTQFGEASEGGDVPKGLRRASKLEVLEVFLPHPTLRDVDIITSLPALRKLFIRGRPASHPVGSQLLNVLGRAVPQVEVVLNAADSRDEEFFKLRCAL